MIERFAKLQRKMSSEHKEFFANGTAQRDMQNWNQPIAEGSTLYKPPFPEFSLLQRLLRTASQMELTPNQIIYELSNELEELKDLSLQALVYRLFFRSPIDYDGKLHLGVGELLLHNDALLDNAKKFIATGLNHFSNSENNVNGARFFLNLVFTSPSTLPMRVNMSTLNNLFS